MKQRARLTFAMKETGAGLTWPRGISYDPNDRRDYTGRAVDQSRTRQPREPRAHAGTYDVSLAPNRLSGTIAGTHASSRLVGVLERRVS